MKQQKGYVWYDRKRRSWFGRWYEDELQEDGTVRRVQRSKKLADYSDTYRSERDVQPLMDDIVKPLNDGKMDVRSTMTLARFVESHYLQEYVKEELKPSTGDGYRKLWEQRLKPIVGKKALRDFTPKDTYDLLKTLRSEGLGRRSLYHAKALLSGIFAYAVNLGVIQDNPVRQAKMVKTGPPKPTHAATLDEVLDMLDALKVKPKARGAIALMYFAGLRPGEARGVRWEDYEAVYNYETKQFEWQLTPRQSVWRTKVGSPKTEDSVKPVPVIEPLRSILAEVCETDGNPQTGPILRGVMGRPLNLDRLARTQIKPVSDTRTTG